MSAKEGCAAVALILEGRFALPSDPFQRGAHARLFRGTDLERDNQIVAVKLFNPPTYMMTGFFVRPGQMS